MVEYWFSGLYLLSWFIDKISSLHSASSSQCCLCIRMWPGPGWTDQSGYSSHPDPGRLKSLNTNHYECGPAISKQDLRSERPAEPGSTLETRWLGGVKRQRLRLRRASVRVTAASCIGKWVVNVIATRRLGVESEPGWADEPRSESRVPVTTCGATASRATEWQEYSWISLR